MIHRRHNNIAQDRRWMLPVVRWSFALCVIFAALFALANFAHGASVGWPKYRDNLQFVSSGSIRGIVDVWTSQDDRNNRATQPDASRHSMGDAIHVGDVALLKRYTGGRIGKGKIVGYDNGNLHRVYDETEDAVYVSGDGNRYSDGWLAKSRVRWVVVQILRPDSRYFLTPPINRG